jgi:transcriptional regulator with XRE-family HTH domain
MFPLGLAIAVYRSKEGVTAEVLAKDLGVSRAFITRIEAGDRLPPLKNEFVEAAAEFLKVPKTLVLTSIICEHYLASMKSLAWFPSLFCKAISMGFVRYYLDQSPLLQDSLEESMNDVNVLSPVDNFRVPLMQELLARLHPVAGDFYRLDREVAIEALEYIVIGVFKDAKPYLYQSESLFTLRDSLIFLDSFGVSFDRFHFDFHTPFTESPYDKVLYKHVIINISPYESKPINIMQMPPVFYGKKELLEIKQDLQGYDNIDISQLDEIIGNDPSAKGKL